MRIARTWRRRFAGIDQAVVCQCAYAFGGCLCAGAGDAEACTATPAAAGDCHAVDLHSGA